MVYLGKKLPFNTLVYCWVAGGGWQMSHAYLVCLRLRIWNRYTAEFCLMLRMKDQSLLINSSSQRVCVGEAQFSLNSVHG